MSDRRKYLDPFNLAKVRSLELQARLIVEGYLSGMHKSPYHGFSVEFAQHREYVPGDDIKHIDWKVYGRTGRFFLKQYEEETNLVCWILLDISESMHYGSVGQAATLARAGAGDRSGASGQAGGTPHERAILTKYDYACMAAAALSYLVLHQSDSVALVTFDSQVRTFLRPSSQPSYLKEMIQVMNQGAGSEKTSMGPLFHDLAERIKRRALVFILSDMFDEVPEVLAGLRHLRHKRHEVVLWHVLDPAELTFPFQEATLFRGLEQYPELLTDPRTLRESYLEQFQSFQKELQRGCRDQDIDYVQLRTDTPLDVALS